MSLFEFLMVLVSLIIGLGIAEILTGVARSIRARDSIRLYWVHGVFTAAIFFALLQQWWEIWGVRNAPYWTFPGLVMMLGAPIGLYLVAHLLFPEPVENADFREYYYNAMQPVWWVALVTVILAVGFRPAILGDELFVLENLTSFMGILFFALLALSSNSRLHSLLVSLILVGLLADILLVSFVIG